VLVTGPTGSGKSTTLAAVIDLINAERQCHIITIEDPIEYRHRHMKALVEQRELGEDTLSFASALKHVLRQDPDVIMVGEMRDLETISAVVTAAETGHLVFSTLHTVDVVQTVDRIIDAYPPTQQDQVRVQLASVLDGVICQRLMPPARKSGRTVACEVMVATDAIRNQIREGKTQMITSTLETSAQLGMITMDRALFNLFKGGHIDRDTLMINCSKPENMKKLLARGGV
jgi:twitching motility protein PilT